MSTSEKGKKEEGKKSATLSSSSGLSAAVEAEERRKIGGAKKEGKKRLSVFLYFFLSPPVVILPRKKIIRGEEEEERNGFSCPPLFHRNCTLIYTVKRRKSLRFPTQQWWQRKSTASFPLSIFILQSQSCAVVRRRVFRKEEKVALNGPRDTIGTHAIDDGPFWYLVRLA